MRYRIYGIEGDFIEEIIDQSALPTLSAGDPVPLKDEVATATYAGDVVPSPDLKVLFVPVIVKRQQDAGKTPETISEIVARTIKEGVVYKPTWARGQDNPESK